MLESKTYSVGDILEQYCNLGIPHFQRALTWSTDHAGRLLESLFHDTPCGSIILWHPLDAAANGLPLEGDTFQQLIVDGQQRVRTLHGAFRAGRHPDESDGVWCVNLVKVPTLGPMLEQTNVDRPLFIHVRDPEEHAQENERAREAHAKKHTSSTTKGKNGFKATPYRYQNNVVPLKWLIDQRHKRSIWPHIKERGEGNRPLIDEKLDELRAHLGEMQERQMVVVVREEGVPAVGNWNLASMVELYNRINSAGIRVEAEERAFASVVATMPTFNGELQKLSKDVHPPPDGDRPKRRLDRDAALARTRERSFGFKLLMRTFVQTLCVHMSKSIGTQGLTFDVVDHREVRAALSESVVNAETATKADALLAAWRDATVLVAATLKGELLHCDDFGFVPDATSLTPAFQLALHFAGGDREGSLARGQALQAVLAWVILRLMLDPPDTKTSMRLARAIQESDTLRDAVGHVGTVPKDRRKKLLDQLEDADSLNNRYVLLLYWLIRRRRANDFQLYSDDETGQSTSIAATPKPINAASLPEKAHIVAYARLAAAYGVDDEGGNRATSHPINNIGNLTYLSHGANHWDDGFGQKWMDLRSEPEEARMAHLIGERVLERYIGVRRRLDPTHAPSGDRALKDVQELFQKMCKARRESIADAFIEWDDELRINAQKAIDDAGRVTPIRPLINPDVADRVRECGYPPAMEDALLSLYRKDPMPIAAKGPFHVAFRVRLWPTKGGTLDIQLPRCGEGNMTLLLNRPRKKAGSVTGFEEAAAQLGLVAGVAATFEHDGADESATLQILDKLTTLASKPTSGRTAPSQGPTD